MLRYKYIQETFAEVPDETSLTISITGCSIHCMGCHSSELWNGNNGEPLTPTILKAMLPEHEAVTCVCLLGGEDYYALNELFKIVKESGLKCCWYTGESVIPKEINLGYLDYIKIGPWMGKPLSDSDTNQRFFEVSTELKDDRVVKFKELKDVTYKFYNKNI